MTNRVTAGARVIVTVEVSRCGSWGPECKLEQIYKQAAEDAVGYIRHRTTMDRRLQIIGVPKVIAVMTEEEAYK